MAEKRLEYPYYEETVTETTWHHRVGQYLHYALEERYRDAEDVFVGANNFVYLEEGNVNDKQSPDVYVCFGARNIDRRSYRPWEEGGVVPQVIIEISSKSSRFTDLGYKKAVYEALGVEEYYVFDPLREYIPQGLRAFRRQQNALLELPLAFSRDVPTRVYSPRLDLDLGPEGPLLRLYLPETQTSLPTYREAREAALRGAEAERQVESLRQELEDLRRRLGQ